MVVSRKIPDMLRQTKKIIIRVLDPEQDRIMRELESNLSTIIKSDDMFEDKNESIDFIKNKLNR